MNFWLRFEQATCLPDGCQCEAPRDAFIRQPSAFWSSLAYIFAGIYIYQYIKHKSAGLKAWASVCVLMGLSSMLGHGSFTRIGLSIDFTSIVLILSFFALWNLFNLLKLSYVKIVCLFAVYYSLVLVAMYSLDKWAKVGICILVFAFAIGDVIREMGIKFLKARTLQLSLFILSLSFGLFLLDENHVGCNPDSLFQLHSIWHLGTSISIYLYGKWRFDEIRAL